MLRCLWAANHCIRAAVREHCTWVAWPFAYNERQERTQSQPDLASLGRTLREQSKLTSLNPECEWFMCVNLC